MSGKNSPHPSFDTNGMSRRRNAVGADFSSLLCRESNKNVFGARQKIDMMTKKPLLNDAQELGKYQATLSPN